MWNVVHNKYYKHAREIRTYIKKKKIPALFLHYQRQINHIYVRQVFIHIILFILFALFYGIRKICTTKKKKNKTGLPPVHDAQWLQNLCHLL